MIITGVRHWTEALDLTRPYTIAYKTISSVHNHFVCLETDTGAVGLGAAAPEKDVTGERLSTCVAALDTHLEALLQGKDIRYVAGLTREVQEAMAAAPAARAAVDMALYDLWGQFLGLPLADIFGRSHVALPTSITIGIQSIDDSLSEADEYIGRGFRILKVKIGEDVDADIELLSRLRDHVGARVGIRVDANQGYSVIDLERFMDQTRDLDLEFMEQPLAADAVDQMLALPEKTRRFSCGDESLLRVEDALAYTCRPRPFGVYNIKLMKCGGITPALQIAHLAHLADIELMWGCMDESIISISAALHAALASPATRYLDLDGSLDLARDLAEGGFVIEDGLMRTNDRPGLGVSRLSSNMG